MGTPIENALDLINTTLENLPKNQFEVEWTYNNYAFCTIFNESNASRKISGGKSIQRNIVLDNSGNAHYRDLFDTDQPTVQDHQKQIDVPWRMLSTNYSWDIFELKLNESPEGYIDLFKTRRLDGMWALADLIELSGWNAPISASNRKSIYGVPYYINKLDTDSTTAGFNGQTIRYRDSSTGTVCAGLDAALDTNAKWRNYAATYVNIDAAFLKTMRTAIISTKWNPPLFVEDPSNVKTGQYPKRVYCGLDQIVSMQDLLDSRDDNHLPKDLMGEVAATGGVLSRQGSTVLINNMPVQYIPVLDDDEDNPIYCVDFNYMQPFVHSDYWMNESPQLPDRGQHTTITVFVDGAHNVLCTSRRKVGFVLHNPILS